MPHRAERSPPTPTPAPSVLIVDDDPDVVQIVALALRDRGYRVAEANDGLDAIETGGFGRGSGVDVLVTDLSMPRTSGFELMRHARMKGWSGSMVVMTASGDQALRNRALELGAEAIFHKPFFLDELLDCVQRLAPLDASR